MAQNNLKLVITAEDKASATVRRFQQGLLAVGSTIAGGLSLGRLTTAISDTVRASNKMQNALIGLSSVAQAFGVSSQSATQAAKSLAADGLMGISDAATGLKNLLASGFSLDQAIVLMNSFKDSAAFGRQSALSFGQAVASATEGIKNGNSILADNAGLTKNLSVILTEAGFSAQDLMRASGDAGVRLALLNGVVRETAPMLGDAARLSQTFSGAQSRLATVVEQTKASIGDLVKSALTPAVEWLTRFMMANQQTIIPLAVAGAAVAGLIATLVGAGGLIASIAFVVSALGGPLTIALLAIGALLGSFVFGAVKKTMGSMQNLTGAFSSGAGQIKRSAQNGLGGAGKSAEDLREKLEDISDQMVKTTRNFREQLSEIVSDHQEKVTTLEEQLNQEVKDFKQSQDVKKRDFTIKQQEMVISHQRRVKDIQEQIKKETMSGVNADQERLSSLNERLNEERDDFTRHFSQNEEEYKTDTQIAGEEQSNKLSDLQKRLDEERSFLNRHATDVASIRDVIRLDEIDKLKRSHQEQTIELEKQKNKAIESARQATAGMASAFNELPGMTDPNALSGIGDAMGRNMAAGMWNGLKDGFRSTWLSFVDLLGRLRHNSGLLLKALFTGQGFEGFKQQILSQIDNQPPPGWHAPMALPKRASGGSVMGGSPYMIGERGPEMFVPNSSGNIVPNHQLGGGLTVNINANIGMYTGTELEKRKVAADLFQALKDVAMSQNMTLDQLFSGGGRL